MPANRSILVRHDGHVQNVPVSIASGAWFRDVDDGVERFYKRAGFACARMSDDEQDGSLVFFERPRKVFENDTR